MSTSSWHVLSDIQQLGLARGIKRWKAEQRGRSVGAYFRYGVGDPWHRDNHEDLLPDPYDPSVLRWWLDNVMPLVSIGISEIGLDGGSEELDGLRPAIRALSRWMDRYHGVKIIVEAVPQIGAPYGFPDWRFLRWVPCIALWRFVWYRCLNQGNMSEWTVPHGQECHVLMEHGREDEWPEPTPRDVAILQKMGWIISWNLSSFDIT
jgi:hypothetical protein